jgi:hypothetical protein
VADARDGLLGFGANLLGVVVNDGARDRRRYAYYGGYGYGSRRPGTIVAPPRALPAAVAQA